MKCKEKLSGVCSVAVSFDLDGNIVKNVEFTGGCNGNLKAISILVDGMSVEDIYAKLRGNECGRKGTSCADRFAQAVQTAYQKAQSCD